MGLTDVFLGISNLLSGAVDFFTGIFFIIYVFILVLIFFALQTGFIYIYFKVGQAIKKLIPVIRDWFDLNKDRFSNLLDRK